MCSFGAELHEEVCRELERIAKPKNFDPDSSLRHSKQYLSLLSTIDSGTKRDLYDNLTYWFPTTGGNNLEKDCILIDPRNQSLLEDHFEHILKSIIFIP